MIIIRETIIVVVLLALIGCATSVNQFTNPTPNAGANNNAVTINGIDYWNESCPRAHEVLESSVRPPQSTSAGNQQQQQIAINALEDYARKRAEELNADGIIRTITVSTSEIAPGTPVVTRTLSLDIIRYTD